MTAAAPDPLAGMQPARALFRRARRGVMTTHSRRFAGFPYGSAVPVATDARGQPVVLVSDLAAHTQDLRADPRIGFTVHDDDVTRGARCTLLGRVTLLDPGEPGAQRYLALHPGAERYLALGDFHFFVLEPEACHFIGGFGDIRWAGGSDYALPHLPIEDAEADIVAHMNADHRHTLRDYCRHRLGTDVLDATMLTADADGFDVLADGSVQRFAFAGVATDAEAVRASLVALAHEARAAGR